MMLFNSNLNVYCRYPLHTVTRGKKAKNPESAFKKQRKYRWTLGVAKKQDVYLDSKFWDN